MRSNFANTGANAKARQSAGFFVDSGLAHAICVVRTAHRTLRSDRADISGFFAFRPGRADEGHALVFREAFKTVRLNILEMGKQIATTSIRGDKAEAFGIVEPFYGASLSSHFHSF